MHAGGFDPADIEDILPFAIIGDNPSIGSTAESIWPVGGVYVWPSTSGIQFEVVSSSASDTAAGTGARTVRITGVNAAFLECSETITLNGVTAVATARTDWIAVNSFEVITAGSGATNAGNIDCRDIADTPIYSRISIGDSIAHSAIYFVPDHEMIVSNTLNIAFTTGAGTGAFAVYRTIRFNSDYSVKSVAAQFGIAEYNSPFQFPLDPPSRPLISRSRFAPEILGPATPQAFSVELRGFRIKMR